MHSRRILIVYSTTYGQTCKIAGRMADILSLYGDSVTRFGVDEIPLDITPRAYDGVIVGASIIHGRHQRSVRDFVRTHCAALNAMPAAFFSVSGSAASPDESGRAEARRCAETFLRATHWRPAITETIGGAMAFTKYGPITRWIMKQISKRNGGPTDTSRDHELTNWLQVQQFVERFAALVDGSLRGAVTAIPVAR